MTVIDNLGVPHGLPIVSQLSILSRAGRESPHSRRLLAAAYGCRFHRLWFDRMLGCGWCQGLLELQQSLERYHDGLSKRRHGPQSLA
jgi:hypothetical protein